LAIIWVIAEQHEVTLVSAAQRYGVDDAATAG
jgi:hypothetical protein